MLELKMPKLGESVTEGTIGKWLKKPGDKVNKYDLLVEVQTDKVNTEIPSSVAGTLREIKVQEGETVAIGTVLALFDTAEDSAAAAPPAAGAQQQQAQQQPAQQQQRPSQAPAQPQAQSQGQATTSAATEAPGPRPGQQQQQPIAPRPNAPSAPTAPQRAAPATAQ